MAAFGKQSSQVMKLYPVPFVGVPYLLNQAAQMFC